MVHTTLSQLKKSER